MSYTLYEPIFSREGFETGWYFAYETRSGADSSYGPFDTRGECLRAIATREDCHACGSPVFLTQNDARLKARCPSDAGVLCDECEPEFMEYLKANGIDPAEARVKPRLDA